MWKILVCLLMVASLTACSSTSEQVTPSSPSGGMMGIGTGSGVFWADAAPRPARALEIDPGWSNPTVFDVWRVDDSAFVEPLWDATFQILNSLILRVDDPGRGVESLLYRMDPSVGQIRAEVAFLSAPGAKAEGLVARMVAADGAGVWIEAVRPAGDGGPTRWILRAEPALEGAPGLMVEWREDGGAWRMHHATGADTPCCGEEMLDRIQWGDFMEVWQIALWDRVTDRDYLEPSFERVEGTDEPLGEGWPAGLGRPLQDRGLDDFMGDTKFIPRTTGASPGTL